MNYKDTSRKAFEDFQAGAEPGKTLDQQILQALRDAGSFGLTDQEIEGIIRRDHQAVSGNRRHLVERGLVRETCLRGKTRSGRAAIRWVLAEFWRAEKHGNAKENLATDCPDVSTGGESGADGQAVQSDLREPHVSRGQVGVNHIPKSEQRSLF